MKFSILITTILTIVLLAACAPAATPMPQPVEMIEEPTAPPVVLENEAVKVTDQRGKEFEFDKPVQRIVSLAPSNTEILFAVGAGSQVVGRDFVGLSSRSIECSGHRRRIWRIGH